MKALAEPAWVELPFMREFNRVAALGSAIQHHQAGRLAEAEALYREVLAHDSNCVDALHYLGVIAHQVGRHEPALELVGRAAALAPVDAAILSNLGEIYRQLNRLDEAAACFQRALAIQPDHHAALSNLAGVRAAQGRIDEAIAGFRQALAAKPDFASAHHNLGNLLAAQGRPDEAIPCFQRAVACDPGLAVAHYNLGTVYLEQGRADEAIPCFERTLALRPDFADAHTNLGNLLKSQGRLDEAFTCFQRALALQPASAEGHNNLGTIHHLRARLDDAVACFQRALELKPDLADARNNLGNVLKDRGQLDEAIACFRTVLERSPDRADLHSNLILALYYRSGHDAALIDNELRRWRDQHARPLASFIRPHANDRSPGRQLRIGYCSRDFKLHSVAFFLLPLLQAHDHAQFHITAYSVGAETDEVTARLRACTDAWRNLAGISDAEAVRRIREDRIDILIDLSGHTGGNRLPVFARKPAPIQVSYLGFPGATGLDTIDYRLTDPWADPPDTEADGLAEQLVRLPETAWCFAPLSGQPAVGELPATRHGYVTFGCFNNFAKVTDDMLRLWIEILRRVPHSRLALKNFAFTSPSVTQRLQVFFAQSGLSADRLELMRPEPAPVDHLQCYDRVDLALDTFPYHGTTTTCEALWMGVPVLTLAGDRHVSRVGVSLLTQVGLPEFVAASPDALVESAVTAASDLSRLAALRSGLRDRMRSAPLMNGARLARAVEAAYRTLWHRWCNRTNGEARPPSRSN